MFLDGKGYAGIAKTLQNEGILSPPKYRFYKAGKSELAEKAREWHPTHVKEILQGEYYIGNIVHITFVGTFVSSFTFYWLKY